MRFQVEELKKEKVKTVECPERNCDKKFPNKNAMRAHLKGAHDRILDQQCEVCDFSCPTRKILNDHIARHHPDGYKKYACKLCKMVVTYKNDLVLHKYQVHNIYAKRNGKMCNKPCPICGARFLYWGNFKRHLQDSHSIKQEEMIKEASRAVTENPSIQSLKCDQCPYNTSKNSSFIKHRRVWFETPR